MKFKKNGFFVDENVKSYLSIMFSFVILFIYFQSTISYSVAKTCSNVINRESLDRCRYGKDDFSDADDSELGRYGAIKADTVDIDGNYPIQCLDVKLEWEPFTSHDYYYQSKNKYCLFWSLLETQIPYYIAIIPFMQMCKVGPTPVDPTEAPAVASDASSLAQFITWAKNTIETLKKVYEVVKAVVGTIVTIASTAALGALTNPLIVMVADCILNCAQLLAKLLINTAFLIKNTLRASAGDVSAVAGVTQYTSSVSMCAVSLAVVAILPFTLIFATTAIIWGLSKGVVNRLRLCGDDWNNFAYTKSMMDEAKEGNEIHDERWYPDRGAYSGSYEYYLNRCFEKYTTDTFTYAPPDEVDDKVSKYQDCLNIFTKRNGGNTDFSAKNNSNILYREKVYRGKEIAISTTHTGGRTCKDPRLVESKGYEGDEQRYYFRGSEAAQYACGRFVYKNQGCILEDGAHNRTEVAQDESLNTKCEIVFEEAYTCCQERRALGVCLYDRKETDSATMCLEDASGSEEPCEVKLSGHIDPLMVVYKSETDSSKLCVKNVNFCPYAFNIGGGTDARDEFCEGRQNCLNPYDSNKDGRCDDLCQSNSCNGAGDTEKNYLDTGYDKCAGAQWCTKEVENGKKCTEWNNKYGDDESRIWNGGVAYNDPDKSKGLIPTHANGKVKNFCQYLSHCTERGVDQYDNIDMDGNMYLPPVCRDFVGDSQFLPTDIPIVDLGNGRIGKLIDMEFSMGEYRGFSAPIAQCVRETLSNMFHNTAGQSECMPGYKLNAEGLCGADTFTCPAGVDCIHDASNVGEQNYYISKVGDILPETNNIFFKIQKFMRNIIRVGAVLALMLIGWKFLLGENLDIFDGAKNSKALIVGMLKFAIVFSFAVGNLWQAAFYDWIDKFSSGLYGTFTRYAFSMNYNTQELLCVPTIKVYECNPINKVTGQRLKDPITNEVYDCDCWNDKNVFKLYGPESEYCKGCNAYAPSILKYKCNTYDGGGIIKDSNDRAYECDCWNDNNTFKLYGNETEQCKTTNSYTSIQSVTRTFRKEPIKTNKSWSCERFFNHTEDVDGEYKLLRANLASIAAMTEDDFAFERATWGYNVEGSIEVNGECKYIKCNNFGLNSYNVGYGDCSLTDLRGLKFRSSGLAEMGVLTAEGSRLYEDESGNTEVVLADQYEDGKIVYISCPTNNISGDSTYTTDVRMKVKCEMGQWGLSPRSGTENRDKDGQDICVRTVTKELSGRDLMSSNVVQTKEKIHECPVSALDGVKFRSKGVHNTLIKSVLNTTGVYVEPTGGVSTYLPVNAEAGDSYYFACPEEATVDGVKYEMTTKKRLEAKCNGENGNWFITNDECEGMSGLLTLSGFDANKQTENISGFVERKCPKSALEVLTFRTKGLAETSIISSGVSYFTTAAGNVARNMAENDFVPGTLIYVACPSHKIINGVDFQITTTRRLKINCNGNDGSWRVDTQHTDICLGTGATETEEEEILESDAGSVNETAPGCYEFAGGKAYTIKVPNNITGVNVQLWGASGGTTRYHTANNSYGGYTSGIVNTSVNKLFHVVVGGQGESTNSMNLASAPGGGAGGFNGGGQGMIASNGLGGFYGIGAGGGGATDIRQGGISINNRIAVAGGGGGNFGQSDAAGIGGGTTTTGLGGGVSGQTSAGAWGGSGGTSTAPGATNVGTATGNTNKLYTGSAPVKAVGGSALTMQVDRWYAGSGGGGGWYGGGASSAYAGGGGSGYKDGLSGGGTQTSTRAGSGFARICFGSDLTPCQGNTNDAHNASCVPAPESLWDAELSNVPLQGIAKCKGRGQDVAGLYSTILNFGGLIPTLSSSGLDKMPTVFYEGERIEVDCAAGKTCVGCTGNKLKITCGDTGGWSVSGLCKVPVTCDAADLNQIKFRSQGLSDLQVKTNGTWYNSAGTSITLATNYTEGTELLVGCLATRTTSIDNGATLTETFTTNQKMKVKCLSSGNWQTTQNDVCPSIGVARYLPINGGDVTYSFIGDVQEFHPVAFGLQAGDKIELEVWGSQGSDYHNGANIARTGGRGGYSKGSYTLTSTNPLYVFVGGVGLTNTIAGGWNGGGSGSTNGSEAGDSYGGGGGTDIRTMSDAWNNATGLSSRIIVAGGGGGAESYRCSGGSDNCGASGGYGGGSTGGVGENASNYNVRYQVGFGGGGTQTGGGVALATSHTSSVVAGFGVGGSCKLKEWGAGGGGGYYGGACGGANGGLVGAGGGGSGYVNSALIGGVTVGGNISFPSPTGAPEVGHTGTGVARISWGVRKFDYAARGLSVGDTIRLRVVGAPGGIGSANSGIPGNGGCSDGDYILNNVNPIYVYVGNAGTYKIGGWNGGGNSLGSGGGGGGATDIREAAGVWNDITSLSTRIIVAGGGGGAGGGDTTNWRGTNGGNGGGNGNGGNDGANCPNVDSGAFGRGGSSTGGGAAGVDGWQTQATPGTFGAGGIGGGAPRGGGGGGGWYGGGGGSGGSCGHGGGGGSGKIKGVGVLCDGTAHSATITYSTTGAKATGAQADNFETTKNNGLQCSLSSLSQILFRSAGLVNSSIGDVGDFFTQENGGTATIKSSLPSTYVIGQVFYIGCPAALGIYNYTTNTRMKITCEGTGIWNVDRNDSCGRSVDQSILNAISGVDPNAGNLPTSTPSLSYPCRYNDLFNFKFRSNGLGDVLISEGKIYPSQMEGVAELIYQSTFPTDTYLFVSCPEKNMVGDKEYTFTTLNQMRLHCKTNGSWELLSEDICPAVAPALKIDGLGTGSQTNDETPKIVHSCLINDLEEPNPLPDPGNDATYKTMIPFRFKSVGLADKSIFEEGDFFAVASGSASSIKATIMAQGDYSGKFYVSCPASREGVITYAGGKRNITYIYETKERMGISCNTENGNWFINPIDTCKAIGTFTTNEPDILAPYLSKITERVNYNDNTYVDWPNAKMPGESDFGKKFVGTCRPGYVGNITAVCKSGDQVCPFSNLKDFVFRSAGLADLSVYDGDVYIHPTADVKKTGGFANQAEHDEDIYIACPSRYNNIPYTTAHRMKLHCDGATGSFEILESDVCPRSVVINYEYTVNAPYEFDPSYYGLRVGDKIKLEVWGASGSPSSGNAVAYGGYSYGIYTLKTTDKLYIYVGQMGIQSTGANAYNGGGGGTAGGGGGGATDIRTVGGAWNNALGLASRIIVAGGAGGGSDGGGEYGGAGGGGNNNGGYGRLYNNAYTCPGGGAENCKTLGSSGQSYNGPGCHTGGGYYGGCNCNNNCSQGGGGGGSGYVVGLESAGGSNGVKTAHGKATISIISDGGLDWTHVANPPALMNEIKAMTPGAWNFEGECVPQTCRNSDIPTIAGITWGEIRNSISSPTTSFGISYKISCDEGKTGSVTATCADATNSVCFISDLKTLQFSTEGIVGEYIGNHGSRLFDVGENGIDITDKVGIVVRKDTDIFVSCPTQFEGKEYQTVRTMQVHCNNGGNWQILHREQCKTELSGDYIYKEYGYYTAEYGDSAYQLFNPPSFKQTVGDKVRIEVYGAANGSILGNYAAGEYILKNELPLVIYVGNASGSILYNNRATDVRNLYGMWNNIDSLNTRIISVGGGGANGDDINFIGNDIIGGVQSLGLRAGNGMVRIGYKVRDFEMTPYSSVANTLPTTTTSSTQASGWRITGACTEKTCILNDLNNMLYKQNGEIGYVPYSQGIMYDTIENGDQIKETLSKYINVNIGGSSNKYYYISCPNNYRTLKREAVSCEVENVGDKVGTWKVFESGQCGLKTCIKSNIALKTFSSVVPVTATVEQGKVIYEGDTEIVAVINNDVVPYGTIYDVTCPEGWYTNNKLRLTCLGGTSAEGGEEWSATGDYCIRANCDRNSLLALQYASSDAFGLTVNSGEFYADDGGAVKLEKNDIVAIGYEDSVYITCPALTHNTTTKMKAICVDKNTWQIERSDNCVYKTSDCSFIEDYGDTTYGLPCTSSIKKTFDETILSKNSSSYLVAASDGTSTQEQYIVRDAPNGNIINIPKYTRIGIRYYLECPTRFDTTQQGIIESLGDDKWSVIKRVECSQKTCTFNMFNTTYFDSIVENPKFLSTGKIYNAPTGGGEISINSGSSLPNISYYVSCPVGYTTTTRRKVTCNADSIWQVDTLDVCVPIICDVSDLFDQYTVVEKRKMFGGYDATLMPFNNRLVKSFTYTDRGGIENRNGVDMLSGKIQYGQYAKVTECVDGYEIADPNLKPRVFTCSENGVLSLVQNNMVGTLATATEITQMNTVGHANFRALCNINTACYEFEPSFQYSFVIPNVINDIDVQLWGGGGGSSLTNANRSFGGYLAGKINTKENKKYAIVVGGAGKDSTDGSRYSLGGFNGGGSGSGGTTSVYIDGAGGGGGATDIRFGSSITDTYNYTGDFQVFDPAAKGLKIGDSLFFEVWGAQGGTVENYRGGYGGYVTGNYVLTSLAPFYIYVGQQGQACDGTIAIQAWRNAWNGGGKCYRSANWYSGSGGGGTDIRTTINSTYQNRIIVAGAGSGGLTGVYFVGANSEANGRQRNTSEGCYGFGATRTGAGNSKGVACNCEVGAGTTKFPPTSGLLGIGGDAGFGGGDCDSASGGGGGYYGGGGGGSGQGGTSGGGGSNYAQNTVIANATFQNGVRAGHGMVKITYSGVATGIESRKIVAGGGGGTAKYVGGNVGIGGVGNPTTSGGLAGNAGNLPNPITNTDNNIMVGNIKTSPLLVGGNAASYYSILDGTSGYAAAGGGGGGYYGGNAGSINGGGGGGTSLVGTLTNSVNLVSAVSVGRIFGDTISGREGYARICYGDWLVKTNGGNSPCNITAEGDNTKTINNANKCLFITRTTLEPIGSGKAKADSYKPLDLQICSNASLQDVVQKYNLSLSISPAQTAPSYYEDEQLLMKCRDGFASTTSQPLKLTCERTASTFGGRDLFAQAMIMTNSKKSCLTADLEAFNFRTLGLGSYKISESGTFYKFETGTVPYTLVSEFEANEHLYVACPTSNGNPIYTYTTVPEGRMKLYCEGQTGRWEVIRNDSCGRNGKIEYDYKGAVQTFNPTTHNLSTGDVIKIEVYGAQGGSPDKGNPLRTGGKGGYSFGQYILESANVLNVYVGGEGVCPGIGWNGGGTSAGNGSGKSGCGGGGRTDIRKSNGSFLIIGGGGGGSANYGSGCYGGIGGGGNIAIATAGSGGGGGVNGGGKPGTQSAAGISGPSPWNGGGGAGGSGMTGGGGSWFGSGAGGGGYYGGGAGSEGQGGGGGSGHIYDEILNGDGLAGVRSGAGLAIISWVQTSLGIDPLSNANVTTSPVRTFACKSSALQQIKFRSKGLAEVNILTGRIYSVESDGNPITLSANYNNTSIYVACPDTDAKNKTYQTITRMKITCDTSLGEWKVETEDSCITEETFDWRVEGGECVKTCDKGETEFPSLIPGSKITPSFSNPNNNTNNGMFPIVDGRYYNVGAIIDAECDIGFVETITGGDIESTWGTHSYVCTDRGWKSMGSCNAQCNKALIGSIATDYASGLSGFIDAGATTTISCASHFTGGYVLKCGENATWELVEGACLAQCNGTLLEAQTGTHNAIMPDDWTSTSTVKEFSCVSRYTGGYTATCTNGVWGGVTGNCLAQCNDELIGTQTSAVNYVSIAGWTNSGIEKAFSCATGYTGEYKATCNNGIWINLVGACVNQCRNSNITSQTTAQNVALDSGFTDAGVTRHFDCAAEYNGGYDAICSDGSVEGGIPGNWSDLSGMCYRQCNLENLSAELLLNYIPRIGLVDSGSTNIAYVCEEGYEGTPLFSCNNGEFTKTSGNCLPSPCPTSTIVAQTAITHYGTIPSQSVASGSNYDIACATNYNGGYVAQCFAGTWIGVTGECRLQCNKAVVPLSVVGAMAQTGTVPSGTEGVLFNCLEHYTGGYTLSCFDGEWTVNGICLAQCNKAKLPDLVTHTAPEIGWANSGDMLVPFTCQLPDYHGGYRLNCNDGDWTINDGECHLVRCEMADLVNNESSFSVKKVFGTFGEVYPLQKNPADGVKNFAYTDVNGVETNANISKVTGHISFGEYLKIKECNIGYELEGEVERVFTCDSSGKWSIVTDHVEDGEDSYTMIANGESDDITPYNSPMFRNLFKKVCNFNTACYEFKPNASYEMVIPTAIENANIQIWGASGGITNATSAYPHGVAAGAIAPNIRNFGGYVAGDLSLSSDLGLNANKLYISVGGAGADYTGAIGILNISAGGYNGGGSGIGSTSGWRTGAGGGGATDVRQKTNNLNSRVIVAGGGGGNSDMGQGGSVGRDGAKQKCNGAAAACMQRFGRAGTETESQKVADLALYNDNVVLYSAKGDFGVGANALEKDGFWSSGGGGGGWYGGGTGYASSGAGGSNHYVEFSQVQIAGETVEYSVVSNGLATISTINTDVGGDIPKTGLKHGLARVCFGNWNMKNITSPCADDASKAYDTTEKCIQVGANTTIAQGSAAAKVNTFNPLADLKTCDRSSLQSALAANNMYQLVNLNGASPLYYEGELIRALCEPDDHTFSDATYNKYVGIECSDSTNTWIRREGICHRKCHLEDVVSIRLQPRIGKVLTLSNDNLYYCAEDYDSFDAAGTTIIGGGGTGVTYNCTDGNLIPISGSCKKRCDEGDFTSNYIPGITHFVPKASNLITHTTTSFFDCETGYGDGLLMKCNDGNWEKQAGECKLLGCIKDESGIAGKGMVNYVPQSGAVFPGTVVNYSCQENYGGGYVATCNSKENWGVTGECVRQQCNKASPTYSKPLTAQTGKVDTNPNTTYTFACNPATHVGNVVLKCVNSDITVKTGTWEYLSGQCIAKCNNSALSITGVSFPTTGQTNSGGTQSATCSTKYANQGASVVATCNDGIWNYNKDCGAKISIDIKYIAIDNSALYSTITLTCSGTKSACCGQESHIGSYGTTNYGGYTVVPCWTGTAAPTCTNGLCSNSVKIFPSDPASGHVKKCVLEDGTDAATEGGKFTMYCSSDCYKSSYASAGIANYQTSVGAVTSGTTGIAVVCATGYVGSYTLKCNEGNWVKTGGSCYRQCNKSIVSQAGITNYVAPSPGLVDENLTLDVACASGYGDGTSASKYVIKCNSTGAWEKVSGSCLKQCSVSEISVENTLLPAIGVGKVDANGSVISGQTVDLACAPNYGGGDGGYTYTCDNGDWINLNGSCALQCNKSNLGGFDMVNYVTQSGFVEVGTSVTYSCLANHTGGYGLTCKNNGLFGDFVKNTCVPQCNHNSATLDNLSLLNRATTYSDGNGSGRTGGYTDAGDTAHYGCAVGFSGGYNLICGNTSGSWTNKTGSCAQQCSNNNLPSGLANYVSPPSQPAFTNSADVLHLDCEDGIDDVGYDLLCSNGAWMPPMGNCSLQCNKANVSSTGISNFKPQTGSINDGQNVIFECATGYSGSTCENGECGYRLQCDGETWELLGGVCEMDCNVNMTQELAATLSMSNYAPIQDTIKAGESKDYACVNDNYAGGYTLTCDGQRGLLSSGSCLGKCNTNNVASAGITNFVPKESEVVLSGGIRTYECTAGYAGDGYQLQCNNGSWERLNGACTNYVEYGYTGTVQEFNPIAFGLKRGDAVKLEVWGAKGRDHSKVGGNGGYTTAIYALEGDTLYQPYLLHVYVGGSAFGGGAGSSGGWNGGGNEATGTHEGSGGGGATDIRVVSFVNLITGIDASSSTIVDSRIIVAGGGGGGGAYGVGGAGGGGNNDGVDSASTTGGKGGGQTAGGAGGSRYWSVCSLDGNPFVYGNAGSMGQGGHGAYGAYAGGAGGGGWWGGGSSGGCLGGGGGGGSGHCNATKITGNNCTGSTGGNTESNGRAKITFLYY
jgi:hypothetical protein